MLVFCVILDKEITLKKREWNFTKKLKEHKCNKRYARLRIEQIYAKERKEYLRDEFCSIGIPKINQAFDTYQHKLKDMCEVMKKIVVTQLI